MTNEELLTQQIQELNQAIKAFVKAAPSFDGDLMMAKVIGERMAMVETTLHWKFNCWELGLPN